jgi:hypothetical protein
MVAMLWPCCLATQSGFLPAMRLRVLQMNTCKEVPMG